ncbi:ATP-binding cassette domain-containing protein, partial [Staphylococcus epidermidis]|uniref:ATP-binding cassette domain-containing protein n=1 Tax=Staphylococcus epidermidis TaxID=1282 RepID=UPI00119FE705
MRYTPPPKTTLLPLLNQLHTLSHPQLILHPHHIHTYKQKHLPHIKKHIPIIFQHFNFLNSKSVCKNLPIPLILTNTNNKQINQKLHQILQFLPLPHKKHQFPHQLSPPQKQPLAIPTPLLTHPKI